MSNKPTGQKPKPTAEAIIAKVAKAQIERKYGSVANAITEVCGTSQKPDAAEKIKAIRNFLCQPAGVLYDTPELHLICDVLDELEQLQKQLAEKDKVILQYEETEAMVCPEDVGIKEYVGQLQKQLAKKAREIDMLEAVVWHRKRENQDLQEQIEGLKHAIGEAMDCHKTKLCTECCWLFEQALKEVKE